MPEPVLRTPPDQQDPRDCDHGDFRADVSVTQISDAGHYMADVMIYCGRCETPFKWIGLPEGSSLARPMRSFNGTELRAPITPYFEQRVVDEPAYDTNEYHYTGIRRGGPQI